MYISSVSHKINIKGGGVHQWYMTFGQQCSINVVFRINFKIKGWGSKTKGWESTMIPPFRGNTALAYMYYIHMHTYQILCWKYPERIFQDLHKMVEQQPYLSTHVHTKQNINHLSDINIIVHIVHVHHCTVYVQCT